jgi:hypothetical protein
MSGDLFSKEPVSIEDQIREVQRELDMRHEVYGRRVANKSMTQQRADRYIQVMEAVLATLKAGRTAP